MDKPDVSGLFDTIAKLTRLQRILIFCGVFVLIVGGFFYFSYLQQYKEIQRLDNEQSKLNGELSVAKRNAAQLPVFRKKMQEAEAKFKIAKAALPEKEEIPALLTGISRSGQDAGLEFVKFQPKPEVKKDFYAEIPVGIKVLGNFHNIAIFFDKVARLNRIVNIKDIHMIPVEGGERLSTECTAVTYKFIEESPNKSKHKKK